MIFPGGVEPPMITSTESMLLSSIFTFAARHKVSGKAAVINKISFNRKVSNRYNIEECI